MPIFFFLIIQFNLRKKKKNKKKKNIKILYINKYKIILS